MRSQRCWVKSAPRDVIFDLWRPVPVADTCGCLGRSSPGPDIRPQLRARASSATCAAGRHVEKEQGVESQPVKHKRFLQLVNMCGKGPADQRSQCLEQDVGGTPPRLAEPMNSAHWGLSPPSSVSEKDVQRGLWQNKPLRLRLKTDAQQPVDWKRTREWHSQVTNCTPHSQVVIHPGLWWWFKRIVIVVAQAILAVSAVLSGRQGRGRLPPTRAPSWKGW